MNSCCKSFVLRTIRDESGQILPWMVFLVVLFLGMAGLTLDIGHAYICYHELQASTDAAALAGAWEMSQSGATVASVDLAVEQASSITSITPNGSNANPNLPNPQININLSCVSSLTAQIPCATSSLGDNALQVIQTTAAPTLFIHVLADMFNLKAAQSINLSAVSTAAMRGAQAAPYNVAIVLDATASMGSSDTDANCGHSRIYCALQGVQTLLASLSPCSAGSSSKAGCLSPFDQVSIFTYPDIVANTAIYDNTCATGYPTTTNYATPAIGATWTPTNFSGTAATYQVTNYLSDYSATDQSNGGFNNSSGVAIAAGGSSTCGGIQQANSGGNDVGQGTYFAGAIYAAQSSLVYMAGKNSSSQNALIILSDGDSNDTNGNITGASTTSGTYPSTIDQCAQALAAANYASNHGTTVYTIAYGASSSGCSTDAYNSRTNPNGTGITPCQTLTQMATNLGDFYSDATASQNKGQCTSADNPNLTLNQIFTAIYNNFTVAKLIPNSVFK